MMPVLYELGHFRFRFSCLSVQSIMHTQIHILENAFNKQTMFMFNGEPHHPYRYSLGTPGSAAVEIHEAKIFPFRVRATNSHTHASGKKDMIKWTRRRKRDFRWIWWIFLPCHRHTYRCMKALAQKKIKNKMWRRLSIERKYCVHFRIFVI